MAGCLAWKSDRLISMRLDCVGRRTGRPVGQGIEALRAHSHLGSKLSEPALT
ncbi:protein of unknown function [Candidatus Nitrosocaldus cavascurensis]|uniref:Uncharacterized protein n=1 Tax=Candidatus Nitrosocaldus cavascurensis TaxID=2058097 RepID=A0A2K5APD0_9ARCH|nr:protein of unknown function [Candidatus Nitrosocaldus cavascurensis]